jgi:hypothetical protein
MYYKDAVFIDRLKEVSPSLRRLGKKLPTKDQLDAAISSGELAVAVPIIDLDLHIARVETRKRIVTEDDLSEEALDLAKLAHDFDDLPAVKDSDNPTAEEVNDIVGSFFAKLETRASGDGDEGTTGAGGFDLNMLEEIDDDGVITSARPKAGKQRAAPSAGLMDLSVLDGDMSH